jgi:small subunit ribosomal protein S6
MEITGQSASESLALPYYHFLSTNIDSYWTLHFDTSPRTVHSLNGLMRRDPRVIRWTILKLGEKPEDIATIHEKTARRN